MARQKPKETPGTPFVADRWYDIGEVRSGSLPERPEINGTPRSLSGQTLIEKGCRTLEELASRNPLGLSPRKLYMIVEKNPAAAEAQERRKILGTITPLRRTGADASSPGADAAGGQGGSLGLADGAPLFDERSQTPSAHREQLEHLREQLRIANERIAMLIENHRSQQDLIHELTQTTERLNRELVEAKEKAIEATLQLAHADDLRQKELEFEAKSQEILKAYEEEQAAQQPSGLAGLMDNPIVIEKVLEHGLPRVMNWLERLFGGGDPAAQPPGAPPGGQPGMPPMPMPGASMPGGVAPRNYSSPMQNGPVAAGPANGAVVGGSYQNGYGGH